MRWVQTSAQGVDRLPLAELAERGVILTRSTLDASVVAAHAIAMAWALARALPGALERQTARCWDQQLRFAPMPRQALVLGQGPVGYMIAERLRAEGIAVACARRSAPRKPGDSPSHCLTREAEWRDALPSSDWCFLALPYNRSTVRLFDESALRSLPPDAVLVNVGRGETLDTMALLRVLEDGHLAGAGLDVADEEPLPPGHPLWWAPRVLLTPHVAAHYPGRQERIERFFESQVERYLAGTPLVDVVSLAQAITEHAGQLD